MRLKTTWHLPVIGEKEMTQSTSIFAGLPTGQISETGRYFPANHSYELQLKEMKVINPRNKPPAIVADFIVLKSSCPEVAVGEERNWYQQKNDNFDGAVLEIICALAGADLHDKTHEAHINSQIRPRAIELATAACEQGAFNGRKIKLETQGKTTEAKKDFTKHNWYPMAQ